MFQTDIAVRCAVDARLVASHGGCGGSFLSQTGRLPWREGKKVVYLDSIAKPNAAMKIKIASPRHVQQNEKSKIAVEGESRVARVQCSRH